MSSMGIPAPDAPGLAAPQGTTSRFDEPFTLQPYNTLTTGLCTIATTVMLAARLYTKIRLLGKVDLEDYSCVLGWASLLVFMAIQNNIGYHGGGSHQWNVRYEEVQYNKRLSNYGDMIYSISLLATKLSIMLLIKRVFCSVQRDVAYWLTIFLIYANTAFYICFLIVPAAECKPRSKIWTPQEPGSCVNVVQLYLASSIFNLLSDLAMLSVPVYLIWRLQMSVRRKVGISAIFCTGGLACIASIGRLGYNTALMRTEDYTYTHMQTTMWAMAEIAFGLLCSCFIVLPRLYQHFCDITPHTIAHDSGTVDPRSGVSSNGKSKRQWVQLEEQAERARRKFSREGRMGDEEALDVAVDGEELNRKPG